MVEIDPLVVKIAADYFGTTAGPRTTIHTQDAFVFLRESNGPYDAIFGDWWSVKEGDEACLLQVRNEAPDYPAMR